MTGSWSMRHSTEVRAAGVAARFGVVAPADQCQSASSLQTLHTR